MEKLELYNNLKQEISECTKCRLGISCASRVPGNGPISAKIMIAGEAPGEYEMLQGKPFVGRSGKLLDRALLECKIDRSKLYVTNTVKCRPERNRKPFNDEIKACNDFLDREIKLINPKIIVALGSVSLNVLMDYYGIDQNVDDRKISKSNGVFLELPLTECLLFPLFHPSYIMRNMYKYKEWAQLFLKLLPYHI